MKSTRSLAAFAGALLALPLAYWSSHAAAPNADRTLPGLSPSRYLDDVKFLASDAMEGREIGRAHV